MPKYLYFYVIPKLSGGLKGRPRFHADDRCLLAATLLGYTVRGERAYSRWHRSCNCTACGGPLNQPAKVLDNNEAKTS